MADPYDLAMDAVVLRILGGDLFRFVELTKVARETVSDGSVCGALDRGIQRLFNEMRHEGRIVRVGTTNRGHGVWAAKK